MGLWGLSVVCLLIVPSETRWGGVSANVFTTSPEWTANPSLRPLPSCSLLSVSACPLPRSNMFTVLLRKHALVPMGSERRRSRYHGNASRARDRCSFLLRVQLKQKHDEQNQNDRHHFLDDELEAVFHPDDVVLFCRKPIRSEGIPLA